MALACCPSAVGAQAALGSGFTLEWNAPSECPDSETVQHAIGDDLQGAHFDGTLHAVARIAHAASGVYALTLQLDAQDGHAERTLSGTDCNALAQAAALLIAIAIDPELQTRAASNDPTPAAAASTDAEQPSQAAAAQPAPNAAAAVAHGEATASNEGEPNPGEHDEHHLPGLQRGIAWGARLGLALHAGAVPSIGVGGAAALELALPSLRFSLGAQFVAPRAQRVAALDDASVRVSGAMALANACARALTSSNLELGPCAEFELGALFGSATGIEQPKHGAAPWFALGAGVEARARLGAGLAVIVAADVLVPSARARFLVQSDQGPLVGYRTDAVALRSSLAIGYEFP